MDTTAHYMLSASALHDLAPGILGVVHGPDGEHEGAPVWGGPVYYHDSKGQYRMAHVAHVGTGRDDDAVTLLDATEIRRCAMRRYATLPDVFWYDLRVEGVRARFVRLCAQALNMTGWQHGVWCRHYGDTFRLTTIGASKEWDGMGRCYPAAGPHPSLRSEPSDLPSFVAGLVLALAPKIAALGGAK